MKIIFATIVLSFLPLAKAFAHEGEAEVTNIAEADWVGPLVAVLIIAGAIIIARIIRARSRKQIIINNKNT